MLSKKTLHFLLFRAGKPATGLHLDVMKETKLIQKLMIDDKKCYLFGRNTQLNDFCIDHNSCSRVHAALVYHKHLSRAFLVDLGSSMFYNYSQPKPLIITFPKFCSSWDIYWDGEAGR